MQLKLLDFSYLIFTLFILFQYQAKAQDITAPTIELISSSVAPNGREFDFIFKVAANDDQGIQELELRAKVNGKPLEKWSTFPYYEAGYPIEVTVDCTYFRFDIRAKDTSGNYSSIISREFRAPFSGTGTIPITELEPLPFVPKAALVESPAVQTSNKSAIITLRKVIIPKDNLNLKNLSISERKNKTAITYLVTVTNKSRNDTKKIISKKNTISLKNLNPGSYSTSYKAELRTEGKVIASTGKSPPAKFNIK